MMHGREKSDSAIVAEKPTNKVVSATAEPVEPRAGAKGNASQQSTLRTQCRKCVSQALERIRQVRRHSPKVGAVCGNSARTDLGGGRSVMTVPTALPSEYFARCTKDGHIRSAPAFQRLKRFPPGPRLFATNQPYALFWPPRGPKGDGQTRRASSVTHRAPGRFIRHVRLLNQFVSSP